MMAKENAPLSRKEEEEKKAAEAQQQSGYMPGKLNATYSRMMNKLSPLKGGSMFKKKANVSQPGDASEIQADAVAKAVTEGNANAAQVELQNDVSSGESDSNRITAKASDVTIETPPGFEEQIEKMKGGGLPLPDDKKANLEEMLGTDLDHVRLHTGSDAAELASDINALAFATGDDIFYPGDLNDEELLAHEVSHTLQGGDGFGTTPILRSGTKPLPVRDAITWNQKNYIFSDASGSNFRVKAFDLLWVSGDYESYLLMNKLKRVDIEFYFLAIAAQEYLNQFVPLTVDGKPGKKTFAAIDAWAEKCASVNTLNYTYSGELIYSIWQSCPKHIEFETLRAYANIAGTVNSKYFALLVLVAQRELYKEENKAHTGVLDKSTWTAIDSHSKSIAYQKNNLHLELLKPDIVQKNDETTVRLNLKPQKEEKFYFKKYEEVTWGGDKFNVVITGANGYAFQTTAQGNIMPVSDPDLFVDITYAGEEIASEKIVRLLLKKAFPFYKTPVPYIRPYNTLTAETGTTYTYSGIYIDLFSDGKNIVDINAFTSTDKAWTPAWREHFFTVTAEGNAQAANDWKGKTTIKDRNAVPTVKPANTLMGNTDTPEISDETSLGAAEALIMAVNALARFNSKRITASQSFIINGIATWLTSEQKQNYTDDDPVRARTYQRVARFLEYTGGKRAAVELFTDPTVHPFDIAETVTADALVIVDKYDHAVSASRFDLVQANALLKAADTEALQYLFRLGNLYMQQDAGVEAEVNAFEETSQNIAAFRTQGTLSPIFRNVDLHLGISSYSNNSYREKSLNRRLEELQKEQNTTTDAGMVMRILAFQASVRRYKSLFSIVAMYEMCRYYLKEYGKLSLTFRAAEMIIPGDSGQLTASEMQSKLAGMLFALELAYGTADITPANIEAKENEVLTSFSEMVSDPEFSRKMKAISERLQMINEVRQTAMQLAILVVAVMASVLTAGAASAFMISLGATAGGFIAGSAAFLTEVLVFTAVDRGLSYLAFGPSDTPLWQSLAENAAFFGVMRVAGKVTQKAFTRIVGKPAEHKGLFFLASNTTALISLQGISELQYAMLNGELMNSDQREKSFYHTLGMYVACMLGGKIAEPVVNRWKSKAIYNYIEQNYKAELEKIEAQRVLTMPKVKPLLGTNPQTTDVKTTGEAVHEIELLINSEVELLERVKAKGMLNEFVEIELSAYRKMIAEMDLYLSHMGLQLGSNAKTYFREVEPGVVAYADDAAELPIQLLKEHYAANKAKLTLTNADLGVYTGEWGAEIVTYVRESRTKAYMLQEGGKTRSIPNLVAPALARFPYDMQQVLDYIKARLETTDAKDELQLEYDAAADKNAFIADLKTIESQALARGKSLEQVYYEKARTRAVADVRSYLKSLRFDTRPDVVDAINTNNAEALREKISIALTEQALLPTFDLLHHNYREGVMVFKKSNYLTFTDYMTANNKKSTDGLTMRGGFVCENVTDIDVLITEKNASGKEKVVKVSQVKSGERDTQARASKQVDVVKLAFADIANGGNGYILEFQKTDVTNFFDVTNYQDKNIYETRGPKGKGFEQSLPLIATEINNLAKQIIKNKGI